MKKLFLIITVSCVFLANSLSGFTVFANAETDTRYCGTDEGTTNTEAITFTRKEIEEAGIKSKVPDYYRVIGNSTCANVAGAIVIGYYDRMCEELIPNFTSYKLRGTLVSYRSNTNESTQVMYSLYNLMDTDKFQQGTTFNGYQNGMKAYVQNHGYNYVSESIGNLDIDKYKNAVSVEKPIVVFLSKHTLLTSISTTDTSDKITSKTYDMGHVVVAYGYRIDRYYGANNNLITTRTYLKVASGLETESLTHLCLDGFSAIDEAIATYIS